MPQPSIAYAVGRVRASARKPLGEAQLERLLAAPSFEDASHILGELGWSGIQGEDISLMSVRMLEQACNKIRSITPEPNLTDAFLLRHDAQNLKSLLKARILGEQPESLSLCGTISPELLRHAVAEHVYKKLPQELALAMETLEKSLALKVNPMEIDARIDRALYVMIQNKLKKSTSKIAKDYFSAKADMQNAVTFLRLMALKDPSIALSDLLLPGGAISQKTWMNMADHPEKLPGLFSSFGTVVKEAVSIALQNYRMIPALEKAADDYLLSLFRPYVYDPFSVEVLIGWLLAHERESAAVRLIMAGKRNGFSPELIRERLREAYGR